ncbi:hypothetical protein TSUD_405470 [Trifolium subterraneum]|uniref:ATP-dependent DNA helicase n=1 Tax=Trifolium subterraneum TaxID=3900 RepID=A0A2Z6PF84_TRISU|nr:hypothetical protein TSUD_405470 [Trifolium subterraneum]
MRLLLARQVGCTSFEDIRTISGCVCDSYRDACARLILLSDDREFIEAIDELYILNSGFYMRKAFVVMLLGDFMSDPLNVWMKKWKVLSDGLLYNQRRLLGKPDLVIYDDNIKQMCLVEIDRYLRPNGKRLSDFGCMPGIDSPNVIPFHNLFIVNKLSYDCCEMLSEHDSLFKSLNFEQFVAYHDIIQAVSNNLGLMFFVDGFGGSGKTYLWNALSCKIRSQGKIVLNVASSGIASLLLLGGRTAHSQFAHHLVLTG